jgi:hypothetical protein
MTFSVHHVSKFPLLRIPVRRNETHISSDSSPVGKEGTPLRRGPIPIASISSCIDRIQFQVRNPAVYAPGILDFLQQNLKQLDVKKRDGKWVRSFDASGTVIQFVTGMQWCVHLVLLNPDPDTQAVAEQALSVVLADQRKYTPKRPLISISQVEYAIDIHPANPADQSRLLDALSYGITLKHGRGRVYGSHEHSIYLGKDGRRKDGAKGVILYPKREHGHRFVRLEVTARKQLLNRLKVGIDSLPLDPDRCSPLDFVTWRDGLEQGGDSKLVNRILRDQPRRSGKWADLDRRHVESLVSCIIHPSRTRRTRFRPVQEQIQLVKQLCRESGWRFEMDRIFPVSSRDALFRIRIC